MDTVDRNYMEALIDKAALATGTARYVADTFELVDVLERLTWAMDFIEAARAKLPAVGEG